MQRHRASAYSSNFDLRSCDLAKIDRRHLCLPLLRGYRRRSRCGRSADVCTSKPYTRELTVYYTTLNPEGNLIVCREVLVFTGILNIYDVRLSEHEVPASFGFVSKAEPREILCC